MSWHRRQLRLTFLVRYKIAAGRLKKREFIPELLRNKDLGWEIPTRVIECGRSFTQQAYTGTLEPSILLGHEHGRPLGRLGFLVQCGAGNVPQGRPCLVSCGHVIGWTRRGSNLPRPGDFIEQPVDLLVDSPTLQAARLTPAFTNLRNQTVGDDFGIAELLPGVNYSQPPVFNGFSQRTRSEDFPKGLRVTRVMAPNGVNGRVRGMEAAVRIDNAWGNVTFPSWTYNNLVVYEVRNREGDSGSCVVETDTSAVVGLHVAGNGDNLGLFYPTWPIAQHFQMQLLPPGPGTA